ncbi:Serine protease, subtilisin family [Micromonospora purpureochromogenes]|uniref:Serine protease, subtilisin family n=1 Tax=Micromonospora purpureochromogenes TaxID=47872 RepID=A0A1C4VAQ3_9ACTN|nr:S8 family serine peptidase [Micromonospora purpureochromogenes]SCE80891.1 Serine protease, subtilisin family [Micromonospora purpureochromogenes]
MSKRFTVGGVATAAALALTVTGLVAPANAGTTSARTFTVVAKDGVSASTAIAEIKAAGGTVVSRTDAVGMFRVVSKRADFAGRAAASAKLVGATQNKAVGHAPRADRKLERENLVAAPNPQGSANPKGTTALAKGPTGLDPLDDKLWGLSMIRADRARAVEDGNTAVTVGILDTGLDASNPDLAANFSWSLSKNFAPDMTDIDGACEVASCLDPVGTDDGGHGSHVAGTVGAAANGFGVSGVAPGVTLVELKGGQDSGYFFLDPVVNALVHAGDKGLDVVNMSFYVDPWLYNCTSNPTDSPEAQAEQRAIITAMKRALNYAHEHGVTLVGALGNNHEDLGKPRVDTSSPDYGPAPYHRPIDNDTCLDLPVEGPHVIGVSSVGPSGRKADYSNYGVEQISVAAPGGWFRDGYGTDAFRTDANMILSSYPKKVLQEEGSVDKNGNIVPDAQSFVFKQCTAAGVCGYYTYLQGTSMASPHAAGVASLIVSRFGGMTEAGFGLAPDAVEEQLTGTAVEHACPQPRTQTYQREGRSGQFNAYCEGDEEFNGFYGYGIVDAYAAVTTPM